MTTQAWPPPDDDPKAPWRQASARPEEPDPASVRCVHCDTVLPVADAAMHYGLDSHGRWLGLGVCRACQGRPQTTKEQR